MKARHVPRGREERAQSYLRPKDNKPSSSKIIIVKNLPVDCTWQKLKDHFKRCGHVLHADILTEGRSDFSVTGSVEFANSSSSEEAMSTLNRSDFGGHRITLSFHKEGGNQGSTPRSTVQTPSRLYVGNLAYEVTWEDLKDHFRNAGEIVVRADVAQDSDGRSKGYGIVQYSSATRARAAIERMSGSVLMGRPIHVREDREEHIVSTSHDRGQSHSVNHPTTQSINHQNQTNYNQVSLVGRKLWVGNLPYNVQWQDLKDHFRGAGNILHAEVLQDAMGRSKGCGIVEFGSSSEALRVMAEMNGSEINGRTIFVREDREEHSVAPGAGRSAGNGGHPSQIPNASHTGGGIGCRLYVGNLPYDVKWQELKDHCRKAGHIIHADVLQDKTGRSKGCGIVEYASEAEAQHARSILDGTEIMGRPIFVREDREEQTHGVVASTHSIQNTHTTHSNGHHSSGGGGGGNIGCRLFVNNLPYEVQWQDLKDYFRPVGNILRADVLLEANGRSKGCGIIEFGTPAEAQRAMAEFNNSLFRGRNIFVREDREQ